MPAPAEQTRRRPGLDVNGRPDELACLMDVQQGIDAARQVLAEWDGGVISLGEAVWRLSRASDRAMAATLPAGWPLLEETKH